ncbi:hypothetical protein EZV62_022649 [Acer yangbiense]|uniref:PPM-type phosphatase domain-containing protein n=1 Tax=Acer yangbiense TaxID=1000413 RepID=A0A5C7H8V7_9ROSI|nr:hypothetical protein EZV62_022649 [Acer yangbiense]
MLVHRVSRTLQPLQMLVHRVSRIVQPLQTLVHRLSKTLLQPLQMNQQTLVYRWTDQGGYANAVHKRLLPTLTHVGGRSLGLRRPTNFTMLIKFTRNTWTRTYSTSGTERKCAVWVGSMRSESLRSKLSKPTMQSWKNQYEFVYLFKGLKKAISMSSLSLNSPLSPSSPQPLSWVGQFLHHDHKEKKILQENIENTKTNNQKPVISLSSEEGSNNNIITKASGSGGVNKGSIKLRKRPARLVLPDICAASLELGDEIGKNIKLEKKEFEIQGKYFVLACKRGSRQVMEDGYGFMVDVLGNPKQAFFTVIDGHGGRAAADYVAENLGKNIVKELGIVGEEEHAIRAGYMVTDTAFLSQGVGSGACAASVLLKAGELHVANVGDCRVVLSRNGVADSLTIDHRLSREDERLRIENSGGFVFCRNGVWRVQGSLAVSRAIGDMHLKEWIISEPEIKKLPLTSDCEFLIMASDGLWDKVNVQEAVDVVSKEKKSIESCKKLIEMSSSRGNMDDITVMVINLQNFAIN